MKKLYKILIKCYFLFSIFLVEGQVDNVNSNWIREDLKKFNELSNFINNRLFKYDLFTDKIHNLNILERKIEWHKIIRTEAIQYGGSTSFPTKIISKGNNIFYLKITLNNDDTKLLKTIAKENTKIKKELNSNWKLVTIHKSDSIENQSYQFIFEDKKLSLDFKSSIRRFFGPLKEVEINDRLKDSYSLLMSPYESYNYGESCSFDNHKLFAREAINNLLDEKKIDLIKNILIGYNIEGRAYALEALIKYHKKNDLEIDDETKNHINKLTKLTSQVTTCIGHLTRSKSYKNILLKIETTGKGWQD